MRPGGVENLAPYFSPTDAALRTGVHPSTDSVSTSTCSSNGSTAWYVLDPINGAFNVTSVEAVAVTR